MPATDTNRPVPAAIDGRRWTVRGSVGMSGATHTRGAEMFVPMVDTPTARFVRNHELMHARITPRMDAGRAATRAGVSAEALQWAEDYRVCDRLADRDLIPDGAITPDEARQMAANIGRDPRMAAGAMLGLWGSDGPSFRLAEALQEAGWDPCELRRIEQLVHEVVRGAIRGAMGKRPRRHGKIAGIDGPRGFKKLTLPLARLFDAMFPPGGGRGGDGSDTPTSVAAAAADRVPGLAKWAPIADIIRATLTRAVKPRRPIGRRFSDCGVIPSAVHRLPVDGSVFVTKRRARGGSILCDASGSMHYSDDDIESILRDAPAAMVAFYAGNNGGGSRHKFGRIVIGANRGRAADVSAIRAALPGIENYIDGPALRWLARQPAPRFWVSDEGVGGVSDFGRGGPSHAECIAICRAAGIKIVRRLCDLKM